LSSALPARIEPSPHVASAVARTHHDGCSARSLAAATAAERALSNSPKQVAPEPDIRASPQPGDDRKAARTPAITGASSIAGASRSLLKLANAPMKSLTALAPSTTGELTELEMLRKWSDLKTSFVATITPGFARTVGTGGTSSGLERMSPMPLM